MPIDGVAAANKLKSFNLGNRTGMCLYWVWQAYDAVGADTHLQADTAFRAWELTDGKHKGDRNPPAGAAVWWGRRRSDGNMDGDVVISLGGGRVVATDQPTWGRVGTCTLAEREALIGREYLGWTDHIFDVPISLPTPATNEGDDFDMSKLTHVRKDFLKGQKIGKKFGPVYLNKDHDVSVAFGGTHAISGTLYVQIKTDKPSATAPAAYQVRAIVATVKNGKTAKTRSLGTHEMIATTGATLAQVPVPPVNLKDGERLRFQIASADGQVGTLAQAIYRGVQVK